VKKTTFPVKHAITYEEFSALKLKNFDVMAQ